MAEQRDIRIRLTALLALVATAAILAAGCGGGDDSPAAADAPEARTYQGFAEQVAQLIAEGDDPAGCKRLEQIDRRSAAELPCPAPEELRDQMDSFEMVDNGLFMSDRAGVVEYQPGASGETTSMVVLLDYDKRWTVLRLDVDPSQPPANAPDDGDRNIRTAMMSYEAGVRKRDCEQIARFAYMPAGTPRPSCDELLADTAKLAKVLKGDPGQRPGFNGGNRDFGFYGLTAYNPKPSHHTLVAIRTQIGGASRWLVSDVVRDT